MGDGSTPSSRPLGRPPVAPLGTDGRPRRHAARPDTSPRPERGADRAPAARPASGPAATPPAATQPDSAPTRWDDNGADGARRRRVLGNVLFIVTLAVAAIAFAQLTDPAPERGTDGTVTRAGSLAMTALEVGDCLEDPGAGDFTTLGVVPCAAPHDLQVVARTTVAGLGDEVPATAALDTAATEACVAAWPQELGAFEATALELSLFTPTDDGWLDGDRTVVCLVADPAGPTRGSVLDAG